MKIGINATFLRKPGTGIGAVTRNFLSALSALPEAREHSFIIYLEEDADLSFLSERFEKRVALPWWTRDDVPRQWLWERFTLPRLVKRDRCDEFLSLSQSATVLPDSIHHVMVVHDIIPRLFPEYLGNVRQRFHWSGIEAGLRDADRVIAVSRCTKNDIVRELGIVGSKIVVVHPAVDPMFYAQLPDDRASTILRKHTLEAGYIYHGGGFEIRKNTAAVLRAYAALRKKYVDTLPPLVLSGKLFSEGNRLATPVRRIVAELGLENDVKLIGFVPDADMPAIYRGALFFVYPSLYEGFGLPPLEALFNGVPVLASRTSSIPEVLGDAALYCDPTDDADIMAGMERLLTDGHLSEELRVKGRRRAHEFSWERFAKRVFEQVIR